MAITKEDIFGGIKELSIMDVAWLVKQMEEEFGVSAAAPLAVAAAPAAAGDGAGEAEDEAQTTFTVTLNDIGPNKINVIKAVREVTSLGLKEAKDLVEAAPKTVQEGVGKDLADEIKKKLEAAGATAAIS